jgi:hypothetical protein
MVLQNTLLQICNIGRNMLLQILLFHHTTVDSPTLICIWNLLLIQVLTEYSSIHGD